MRNTAETLHRNHTLKVCPSLLRTKMSTSSGDELNPRHLPRNPHDDLHNRDIVHLVRALQLRGLHSFLLCQAQAPVVVQQRASSALSKNSTCANSTGFGTVCTAFLSL